MSEEREIRKETDFWGNEKEVIYENNRKVGEVNTEERGGFFGIGGESVKVEYDNSGREVSHSKQEERGGILGIGSEQVEVRYDSSGKEIGHSRVEERGGFFGIGGHHVRVEYDNDQNETSQTYTERRGDFLGIGGERVRVTKYSKTDANEAQREVDTTTRAGSGSSSIERSESSGGILWLVLLGGLIVGAYNLYTKSPNILEVDERSGQPVNWTSPPKLSLKGFGAIRIGMTLAEARSAAADPLTHDPSDEQDCFYVKPTGAPDGLAFMITDGRISRVDITSPSYSTMSGARVGQTQDHVIRLYTGKLEIAEHQYDENGRYLTYIPADTADQPYRMVFETDGNRITRFRAGKLPEVQYVEGCL